MTFSRAIRNRRNVNAYTENRVNNTYNLHEIECYFLVKIDENRYYVKKLSKSA